MYRVVALMVVLAACGSASSEPVMFSDMVVAELPRDVINYRLAPHWRPTHYKLWLVPFIPENLTFDGRVEIRFTALADVSSICLHEDGLEVHNDSLAVRRVSDNSEVAVVRTSEDTLRHFYVIELEARLQADEDYEVSMNYTGLLQSDKNVGFYLNTYVTASGEKRFAATTQFEATYARKAFPCFDEPQLKAKFIVRISRLGNMKSISNMPQDGPPVQHLAGVGRYWDTFQETPPMSTYNLAFVVSDFANLSDEGANLRIFAQPPLIELAHYSLKISPLLLAWLEGFTAIKFTLPKMDEVAMTQFESGAMENWGLVIYREEMLLLEEGKTTTSDKQGIVCLIAHEYAHQWFGNLVTLHWWSSVWINEGFAAYFQTFGTAQVEKTWRLEEQFVVTTLQLAMGRDDSTFTHAMTDNSIQSPSAIAAVFDAISYLKGASVLRMMEHMVSSKTFQKGLRNYLEDRSYSTGTPDILFLHMMDQLRKDNSERNTFFNLLAVMKTWTELKGFPMIHVERNYQESSARITQRQFLTYIFEHTTYDPKWFVPLTFTTQRKPDFTSTITKRWLKPSDSELVIPGLGASQDMWVLFNIQVTGYYRVNYDDHNWMLLSNFLNSDKFKSIPAVNRAQLIDDAFSMAGAGHVSYCVPLALSRYLVREKDYIPWVAAIKWFEYLYRRLQAQPDFPYLTEWMSAVSTPAYEHVGFEETEKEDHVTGLFREKIVGWAIKLGLKDSREKAKDKFDKYRYEGIPVEPDVKYAVYCYALAQGGKDERDFLLQERLKESSPSHKNVIEKSLGCSKNSSSHERYLQMAISNDSSIPRLDAPIVYNSVLNSNNEDVALDFFVKNFRMMDPKMGSFYDVLSRTTDRLMTGKHLTKLGGLLKAVMSDKDKARAVEFHTKKVEGHRKWSITSGRVVLAWVRDELAGSEGPRDCRIMEDPQAYIRTRPGRSLRQRAENSGSAIRPVLMAWVYRFTVFLWAFYC